MAAHLDFVITRVRNLRYYTKFRRTERKARKEDRALQATTLVIVLRPRHRQRSASLSFAADDISILLYNTTTPSASALPPAQTQVRGSEVDTSKPQHEQFNKAPSSLRSSIGMCVTWVLRYDCRMSAEALLKAALVDEDLRLQGC